MKARKSINKIKSKYIYDEIFEFSKDINLKLKLLKYSKQFQKLLHLNIFNYQKGYLQQFNIDLDKYLLIPYNDINLVNLKNKNILQQRFNEDLLKYEINSEVFQNYIIDYFQNHSKNQKLNKNYEKEIDIFSPLFDILSKYEFFGEIFSINIYMLLLKEFDKDYIKTFTKLNKIKYNYSINYYGYKSKYIFTKLKELKIKFNKLNKLSFLNLPSKHIQIFDDSFSFLNNMFSFINFKNLKYLNIELESEKGFYIDTLKELNNLDFLEELRMSYFHLNEKFILNLKQLKILYIRYCENITFSKNICFNLRTLNILHSKIVKDGLFSFPNLEELKLKNKEELHIQSLIDIKSLQNLNQLNIEIRDFINLENINTLNILNIFTGYELKINSETEIKMIKAIILLKNLKEVSFDLLKINNNELSKITGSNYSIIKLGIKIRSNIIIDNLLDKFPNLSELDLNSELKKISPITIEIKENSKCKINKLKIKLYSVQNIKLFCQSFDTLEKFDFSFNNEIKNVIEILPLFNFKCKNIFKNLNSFSFQQLSKNIKIDKDLLKILYINLDKMPNLKNFIFVCYQSDIKKDFYEKFIVKLLSLKLYSISLQINKDIFTKEKYSETELKEIYPDFNMKKMNNNNIKIYKLNI